MAVTTYLQLGPLDPAHASRGIPPGVLGAIDKLRILELVGVGAPDLLAHLLQPVHVGLGAKPKGGETERGPQCDGLEVFSVCVCAGTQVCMHEYMCTCICMHVCACVCWWSCMHKCVCMCVYTCKCMRVGRCMCIHMCMCGMWVQVYV